MATKRFFDDSDDQDPDEPPHQRVRPTLASVIGEVVMVKNLQNLLSGLEPLLRRVVSEEVEGVMRRMYPRSMMTRSASLRIQAAEEAPNLELSFKEKLSLPIFTGSRIQDINGNPIQVVLVDKSGNRRVPTSVHYPMKLEVVVLDGDFPPADKQEWTSNEFSDHIVKERAGKRPLLAGELNMTMRNGIACLGGDIEFTDNSSWIRSRKFRVAVRVVPGTNPGPRVLEGFTEPFVVKDHRGELYKKHHPPVLEDEVWRLEKIGKDGAFHRKLSANGINNVQEFLKLSVVDPARLREILGIGMSEKMWEATLKHARSCKMENKLYIYRGPHFAVFLNPICQLVRAEINGHVLHGRDLNNINRSYVEKLVREAYARWDTLEEAAPEGLLSDNVSLLAQGETVDQIAENLPMSCDLFGDKSAQEASYGGVAAGGSEWSTLNSNPAYPTVVGNTFPFSFSESQSEVDNMTPSGSVIHGSPKWS
ncbi:protein SAR DEFICIENT 1-like [Neltuma alba]|uniref:protein SAR DEFICIENT 1-like n=1 Tax=Neltuma alba TaxID=207710 RepID=UPI0010A58923|nr:protein SAR DEFICIENT 1-like [Prosopis alba]XP_028793748.1 protein SAR DEFICIENT 1-like [Prosopis alba]